MVKVINIDTKTRTIRVENADSDIKTWRTTESGAHFPIKKGESTKEALDKFVEKKRPEAKKEYDKELWKKAHAEATKRAKGYPTFAEVQSMYDYMQEQQKKQQPAKPSKSADVSDIVKNYKKQMEALGPRASIKKTDRVEADAIKEFMTRKLGANRPYEDYYQYWLRGMDKKTSDQFNEINAESEAREIAFSELASDVDHSGLARGEPTYEELEKWSQEQKAKKQQPAKKSSGEIAEQIRKYREQGMSSDEILDQIIEDMGIESQDFKQLV